MEATFKLREQAVNEGCMFRGLADERLEQVLKAATNKAMEVCDLTDVVLLTVKVEVRAYVGGVRLEHRQDDSRLATRDFAATGGGA